MRCNNDNCEIERTDTKQEGYPTKRDLDGAYFRVERDGKWQNLCFSDLTGTERNKQMAGKNIPWFISMCNHLAVTLHAMGDAFDITSRDE